MSENDVVVTEFDKETESTQNHDDIVTNLIPGLRLVCDSKEMLQSLADLLGFEDTEALKAQLNTLLDVFGDVYSKEVNQ